MLLAALLLGVALAGSALALLAPGLMARDPMKQRVARMAESGGEREGKQPGRGGRQKSIGDLLREIEEVQRQRGRRTLRLRLRQAGLSWSKPAYIALCVAVGGVVLAAGLVFGLRPLIAAGFAVGAGAGLPELALRVLRKRRMGSMEAEFPNVVDIIVRGVKSGLPLPDCLRIIAAESREPLRSEFGKVVRDQAVGLSTPDAIERLASRVPLTEASFFAIVIAIQSGTGGSLSESLANLSTVLRERKKMRAKVRALSAEAKASAMIIGSLPLFVTVIIYMTSPDYILLLFQTALGQMVLAGSALWMLVGILIMRRMINFEI